MFRVCCRGMDTFKGGIVNKGCISFTGRIIGNSGMDVRERLDERRIFCERDYVLRKDWE